MLLLNQGCFNVIIFSGWTGEDGKNRRPIEQTQCWRLLFEGAWCRTGAGEEYAQEGNKDKDKDKYKDIEGDRAIISDFVTQLSLPDKLRNSNRDIKG